MNEQIDIEKAKDDLTNDLMQLDDVVAVGIGECDEKPCIKVFVVERTPDIQKIIPQEFEGYIVDIEETAGPIEILPVDKDSLSNSAFEVQQKHEDYLLSIEGVVGVGTALCEGEECLVIFVSNLSPESKSMIPNELDGYKVVIEDTGGPITIQE